MVTVVTKQIGMLPGGTIGPGRHFKNLTEFEAALPPDLTDPLVNEQWTAQLYNDGVILENSGAPVLFGEITDATRFVRLEAAPGHSFMDHDFTTDPLRLDPAYGVTVKGAHGGNFDSVFNTGAACDYMQVDGLQLWTTDPKGRAGRLNNSFHNTIDNCILLADNPIARETCDFTNSNPARNCLIIAAGADALSNGPKGRGSTSFINCTIVRPSDLVQGHFGVDLGSSNAQFENCAIFGFSKAVDLASTGDFNATDDSVVANLAGANTKRSLTFASQFVNTTLAGQDWKVKDSTADIADGGASVDSHVTGFDILGRARDATLANRSIGAFELISGGVGGSAVLTGGGALAAVSSKNAATGLVITTTAIVSAQIRKQAAGGAPLAGGGTFMAIVRKLASGSGIISVAGALGAGVRKLAAATALLTGGGSMMATGGVGGADIYPDPDPVALAALAKSNADLTGQADPVIALNGFSLLIESF